MKSFRNVLMIVFPDTNVIKWCCLSLLPVIRIIKMLFQNKNTKIIQFSCILWCFQTWFKFDSNIQKWRSKRFWKSVFQNAYFINWCSVLLKFYCSSSFVWTSQTFSLRFIITPISYKLGYVSRGKSNSKKQAFGSP